MRVVVITLDGHLAGAVARARRLLADDLPSVDLRLHVAADWASDPAALERCREDIDQGDIVIAHMLFLDEHIEAVLPWLTRRREHCDAMVGCMSGEPVVRLTRMGRFRMDGGEGGLLARLKGLRKERRELSASNGARQMAMLRRIPQLLRFVPGTAQDVRAYFLTMQYWLAGTDENVADMVRFLVSRYAAGPRSGLRGRHAKVRPRTYPEIGVYHPRMAGRMGADASAVPTPKGVVRGTVGVLVMRSYVLAGSTAHYDAVIDALETKGLRVLPVFASGLDARPAVERFFVANGRPCVDAVVSLTGFSLVGGPAYNDAGAAETMLRRLDVPYVVAQAVEFQSLAQWEASPAGLLPIEATMMVAIPELDGATGPIVFGGRARESDAAGVREMEAHPERAERLAERVVRRIALRKKARRERRVAIVLFNFPPNAGNTGTAMHLAVFASLHNVLVAMRDQGYAVEVPPTVDALRERITDGNAALLGAPANVHRRIPVDDHVRREPSLAEIEAQWGPAPGRQLSDGSSLFVLGERFGNVFVGVQPAPGYEGDPMRLLFEQGFAPTHAFSAFHRFLREDFAADAILHFGTHGALEFLPGKQVGLSAACWPDRLLGDVPNFYLYAADNPSEGTIAKRRTGATLVSHRTPPIAQAGLYRGLRDLDASLQRWRGASNEAVAERTELAALIQEQAAALDLVPAEPSWVGIAEAEIATLVASIRELERTLVPEGLHVVGEPMAPAARVELLRAIAEATPDTDPGRGAVEALVATGHAPTGAGASETARARLDELAAIDRHLTVDAEIPALLHALDGRFVPPVYGGDVLRNPAVLPTGRNLHGFDPFRMPSAFAMRQGERQAERLLDRHRRDGNALPESIGIVLWGSDNLKTEGGPLAQALALLGARPRFDGYGRLAGAQLVPLGELGWPRIDVVVTLSGIFRDLFPLQTRLLAEASLLAASADEPLDRNFVRKHALAQQRELGCDLETAALRVFSNALGAYGANVSQLVQSDAWGDEDELAETFSRRKSFAYGVRGAPEAQPALMQRVLAGVELAYQSLDSVEVGVTTVDVYFDNLGGLSRAVRRAGGAAVPVYVGDETQGEGRVRTLGEQVALETRTRMLNPKWYEGLLRHGFEGVRQIETHVTNTLGWSATTGDVAPWVYREIASTYVLDDAMRERMAALNPTATAKLTHRLLEAHERSYWRADAATLDALRRANDDLEDRLEGVTPGVAA